MAAWTPSGVRGPRRRRAPVASKIALPIAAAVGRPAGSPAPLGDQGSSNKGQGFRNPIESAQLTPSLHYSRKWIAEEFFVRARRT